ncbi:MAG: sugar diacid recognition domain-containing protein, partial [Bacillota bacterium]|nr:sugar diacid recognition domain-containing protein [Bacillota bacterium]
MQIININVNIFDDKGYIIGSGQKERLLTFHAGALEVAKSGASDEYPLEKAEKYEGVKPGILYPIEFNDKVIGVVGMTGNPEE